jgi:FAD/FMN-containing dehydrogenase
MSNTVSRRHFLQGLASLGARGLGALGPLGLTACVEEAAPGASRAIDDLARRLPQSVLRPGDPAFASFTTPWNLRWVGRRPTAQAVVRATSAEDVSAAIRWARETSTPIVARSGGHSYTGYSTTSGVVIDVSSMHAVTYDAATERAAVSGGARNRDAYAALARVDSTITHGRCYGVGVAGLVLGGGIGFNMRRFGLTCDQLVDTEVVLASGEIVRASASENPDLFWGARGGGGGNFGIHTAFTFQTHAATDLVVFDLVWTTDVESVLRALIDVLHEAPRALGAKFNVRATRGDGNVVIIVSLLGQLAGSRDELEALLAPVYAIARPDPSHGFVRAERYWDGQALLSEEGPPELSYERSRYVVERLSDDAVAAVLAHLRVWPTTSGFATWKGFLTGGAVGDVVPDATAFVHRGDWLLSTIDVGWSADDPEARVLESLEWVDAFHEAMMPFTSRESYQNFIDDSETDWARAYYGANLERLVEVKRAYDPDNVFAFAQSIPLAIR